MIGRTVSAAALAIMLAGCTTELTRQPLTEAAPTKPGVPYYLPKQVHSVEVSYELVSCTPAGIEVRQTATITEFNVADLTERYLLTYRDLDSEMKTTEFTASLNANQTLKSVGATVSDQTAEVIKNVGTAIVNVASMALLAHRTAATICHEGVNKRLATLRKLREKVLDPSLTAKQRAEVIDVITRLRAGLTQQASAVIAAPTATVEFGLSPDQRGLWLQSGTAADARKLTSAVTLAAVAKAGADDVFAAPAGGEGLVYRQPAPAVLTVCAGSCAEGDSQIAGLSTSIAQLGRKFTVLLKNEAFEKSNVAVTFAPNGALETLSYGNEARLAKASAALAGITGQVGDFVTARRAADRARADTAAGAELRGIEAETAMLAAKAERIEARRRLEALEAGGTP
jgi:hypothetical protein